MVTELTSSSGRGVGGVDAVVVQVVLLPPHPPQWVWRLAEVLGPCLPSALWLGYLAAPLGPLAS